MPTIKEAKKALDCPVGEGPDHYAHYGAPCCDDCWEIIKKYIEGLHANVRV